MPAPGSRVFSCNDGAVSNPLKFGEVVGRRLGGSGEWGGFWWFFIEEHENREGWGGGEFVRFAQIMDARKMRQISDGGVPY